MYFNNMAKSFFTAMLCIMHWTLGLTQSGFTTDQNADLMISGVGFNHTGGALSFNHPNGLASDGSNLLMCDRFNNRVLIWLKAPTSWDTPPDLVLGQQNFTDNNPGITKSSLNWPGNVSVSPSGKLAIADSNNDRLLLWNNFPTQNGQPADISIHLPSIWPGNTPQKWEWPWGIWTDGTRLAAVATQGATILFWNTFPITDNQKPDYTITNPDFGTPRNISTDGAQYFFVGDHNARVHGNPGTFFWNSYPISSNQKYDFYRDEWIKGTKLSDGKLIASGLSRIYTWNSIPTSASQNPDLIASPTFYDNGDGVDVVEANGKIYICNYNGNNILVYDSPPDQIQANPLFAVSVHDFHNNTLDSIGYIQNPAMSSDGTRLIITSDYYKRMYIYDKFPTVSGEKADQIISTAKYNLAAWDNALHNNTFVAAGRNTVCIWNDANKLDLNPSTMYHGKIGSASFNDLKGVALDDKFFYLADKAGMVYIWDGIPGNNSTNPLYSLNFGNVQLNRLSSDGTYFCVTQQSPAAIFIYKVSDLENGNISPWKTINQQGLLNLPSEAITYQGSLAIANQSFNDVLIWEDVNQAPNTSKMIILGQSSHTSNNKPAIGTNRLFMPGSLLYQNNQLWVGEHKFSSRILKFSAVTTGNHEPVLSSPEFYIYPNPFSENANIVFTLTENSKVTVSLTNVQGQHFGSVLDIENLPEGTHSFELPSLAAFPDGVYIADVWINDNHYVRKIVKHKP